MVTMRETLLDSLGDRMSKVSDRSLLMYNVTKMASSLYEWYSENAVVVRRRTHRTVSVSSIGINLIWSTLEPKQEPEESFSKLEGAVCKT